MAEPARTPPPVATPPNVREQARKIPATEKGKFFDWVKRKISHIEGSFELVSAYAVRKKMLAIVDLYPWPSNEALRTAAEKRMCRIVGGAAGEILSQDVYELIHDLLENPDALLD